MAGLAIASLVLYILNVLVTVISLIVACMDNGNVFALAVALLQTFLFKNAHRGEPDSGAKNVTLGFSLPKGLEFVRGSTTLYNDKNPKGAVTEQDEGDVVDGGVNVGDYATHGDAYLVIRARVVDDHLVEGANKLVVWSKASEPNVALCNSMEVVVDK